MNNKRMISIFLGFIVIFLIISVYPLRFWNSTYTDQYDEASETEVLRLSEVFPVKQKFTAQYKKLRSISILLENIQDHSGNGYLDVSLMDNKENILKQQKVPYRLLHNGKVQKIKLDQICDENEIYLIEIKPSAETYADIRVVSNSKNAPAGHNTFTYHDKNKSGGLAMYYQYEKYFTKTQVLMIWMILGIACITTLVLINSKPYRKAFAGFFQNVETWKQIWIILMAVSVFNLNAFVSPAVVIRKTLPVMLPCLILWMVTGALAYYLYHTVKWKEAAAFIQKKVIQEKEISIVLLICAVLRIFMMDSMPKWDAGEYYYSLGNACRNYAFTFESFFNEFRLCTHSNLGFSFIMAIAEFLAPRNPKGVYVWNLILTLCALYCLYILIHTYWLKNTKICAASVTLAVSATPIFLGTFAYVNVDYVLALFFIFVMYFEYKKQYVLMAFCTLIMSQTKETGIVVAAGYFGIKICMDFLKERGCMLHRVSVCFQNIYLWIAMWAAAVYGCLIIKIGGFTNWQKNIDEGKTAMQWSNTGINCFGFQPDYIVYKLKQFFVLNFAWVFVFFIVISFAVILVRWFRCRKKITWYHIVAMAGTMAALVLFGIIYITYTLPRYNILFALLLSVIAFYSMYEAVNGWLNEKAYVAVTCLLAMLMCVQSFWSIDPLSEKIFQEVEIGSGNRTMLFSSFELDYYGDGLVTNYQYHWLDKAYNRMLKDIGYNGYQRLILSRKQMAGTHINGNNHIYEVGWNEAKNKREIKNTDKNNLKNINVSSVTSSFLCLPFQYYDYETADTIAPESYLVFVPFYQEKEDEYLKAYDEYCYHAPRQEAGAYGGNIAYYPLIVKDQYQYVSLKDLKEALSEQDQNTGIEAVDLNQVFDQYLKEAGWSEKKADEYFNYKKYNSGKSYSVEEGRTKIKKMDIIKMEMEVFDQNNEKLSTVFVGNAFDHTYENIVVGNGSLLKEVDQALTGAEIGKAIKLDVQIPETYKALHGYAGQKLHFVIEPVKITGRMEYDTQDQEELSVQVAEKVWAYYRDKAMKRLLLETIHSDFNYDETDLSYEIKKIDQYMESYFMKCEITQKEFLEKYLEITNEEYDQLKLVLAQASIRANHVLAVEDYQTYQFYLDGKDGYYQGNGFYTDGWMSDTGQLFIVNKKSHNTVSMKYYAPENMEGEILSIWKQGRCIKSQRMKPGIHEITWELEDERNVMYQFDVSSLFNPKKEGESEDSRDLSILIQDLQLK
ncbi:MAG: hypothetical protein K2N87_02320 [Eubacterium sp.]|nr:hypothetical protein [Eubacterium sp.]